MGFDFEKVELSEEQLADKLKTIISKFDFIENKNAPAFELMKKIIEIRNEARIAKNWAIADKIRDGLAQINIVLKDTKDGVTNWELK